MNYKQQKTFIYHHSEKELLMNKSNNESILNTVH